MRPAGAFFHHVTQVGAVKTGDVFIGYAEFELFDNVVADLLRGAGRERRDGPLRKILPQAAELAVFRAKLMPPFGDAMRLVDGKK